MRVLLRAVVVADEGLLFFALGNPPRPFRVFAGSGEGTALPVTGVSCDLPPDRTVVYRFRYLDFPGPPAVDSVGLFAVQPSLSRHCHRGHVT